MDVNNISLDDFDLDVCVSKNKSVLSFNIFHSADFLAEKMHIPKKSESVRMLSPRNGWSSFSVVLAIHNFENIREMYATTLRLGKREARQLSFLGIDKVVLALGRVADKNGTYEYDKIIDGYVKEHGWIVSYVNNHSKVILLKTDKNYYVIETSSNLNGNPQIEQFCVTNCKKVYDFYIAQMKKLGVW